MNTARLMLIILVLAGAAPAMGAEEETAVPHEINGFRLGASIDDYEFISNLNYLKEVVIEDFGAYRKGVISYGTCKQPGKIVKIHLKYKDPSHKFYKELFKRYQEKFGKPDEYTGDTFGVVISWKWRFTDKDGTIITLVLQHNQKNVDENIGNQVKLAMPERMKEERLCFKQACDRGQLECPGEMMDTGWENLIPR
jgi:hypothetical protein